MNLLFQLGIVFGVSWVSVCVEKLLPIPFPASILSMLLLLLLLGLRVVRTEHVQAPTNFLLSNLPFFFLPATVSIINYIDVLQSNLVALVVICLVTTPLTFAVTVWAVRLTNRLLERGRRP